MTTTLEPEEAADALLGEPAPLPARPQFRGLVIHRDLKHRFSLLYPDGWSRADAAKRTGGGVVLAPDAADEHTYLLVQGHRLPGRIEPDDVHILKEGLTDGVRKLPEAVILREKADALGKLIDAEVEYTFRDVEHNALRHRWVRLLCQDRTQISLIAQGSSDSTYEYWLSMFSSAMRTVQFADWWAEATGRSWQKTIAPGDV